MENLAQQVRDVAMNCLYTKEEIPTGKLVNGPPEGSILVEGVVQKFAFHPGRVEANKDKIREFLNEMDPRFHKLSGGGWTFLNLCQDKEGNQWTGEHRTVEMLVVLAIAAGMSRYSLPRELWKSLPGGMPYIVFNTTQELGDAKPDGS